MPPQLWVIAGPNGCGKSSLAKKFAFYQLPLVNPDTIAFELNPQDVPSVAIRAGKLALQMQQEYLLQKRSFIIETTLSGKHELRLMQKARELGFKVNLVYVCVDNPIISSGRVLERVARGGILSQRKTYTVGMNVVLRTFLKHLKMQSVFIYLIIPQNVVACFL